MPFSEDCVGFLAINPISKVQVRNSSDYNRLIQNVMCIDIAFNARPKKNNKPFSENVAVISCICMTKRIPSHKMNKNACLMTLEAKKNWITMVQENIVRLFAVGSAPENRIQASKDFPISKWESGMTFLWQRERQLIWNNFHYIARTWTNKSRIWYR